VFIIEELSNDLVFLVVVPLRPSAKGLEYQSHHIWSFSWLHCVAPLCIKCVSSGFWDSSSIIIIINAMLVGVLLSGLSCCQGCLCWHSCFLLVVCTLWVSYAMGQASYVWQSHSWWLASSMWESPAACGVSFSFVSFVSSSILDCSGVKGLSLSYLLYSL